MARGAYRSVMVVGLLVGLCLGAVGCTGNDGPVTFPCTVSEEDVAGIWYYCEDCVKSGLQPQSKIDFNASGAITFELPEQECDPFDGSGVIRTSTGSWTMDGCFIAFSVTSAPPPDDQACSVDEGVGTAEIAFIDPVDSLVLRAGGDDVLLRRNLTDLDCYCVN